MSSVSYSNLLERATEMIERRGNDALGDVCELLKSSIPYYNWVGFYRMNNATQILEIGPYAGAETDHTRIPYGKGICGQVAVSGDTFTVQDVTEQDNYIACSIETKAEIVVPMYLNGELIGQIDIDSHHASPFTEEDEAFLKSLCEIVAPVF